ncbi:tail tube protein [Bacillus phage vB_BauM_KLEB27-3]|nr:tail tube protein [Bacillus phage vB_BauM_KLEB27-3]
MASDRFKTETYTSFSGADIVATITPIGGRPVVFGTIQTISYSIYRPMTPVRALGRINPKGVTRGPRTIAGSIIFTVFDRHVLQSVMDSYSSSTNKKTYNFSASELLEMKRNMRTDEMPPFDVNITFMNEYGNASSLNLYGLHIVSEGQTMSIEDMITENTMQYIAMDIDLMKQTGSHKSRR